MAVTSNWKTWSYGQDGPGGGSLPHNVMATGSIAPFSPMHVRRDIQTSMVEAATRIPVAQTPGTSLDGVFGLGAGGPLKPWLLAGGAATLIGAVGGAFAAEQRVKGGVVGAFAGLLSGLSAVLIFRRQ